MVARLALLVDFPAVLQFINSAIDSDVESWPTWQGAQICPRDLVDSYLLDSSAKGLCRWG